MYSVQKESLRYSEFYEAGVNDEWRFFIHGIRDKVAKGEDVTQTLNEHFLKMVNMIISMNK